MRFSCISTPSLAFLAMVLFLPVSLSAQTVLVPPFAGLSRARDAAWVAEGFAEGVTSALSGQGFRLVRREERVDALSRLGLPVRGDLTRASLLRVAEEIGAGWIVLGNFQVSGDGIAASARLLKLSSLGYSAPVEVTGRFANVQQVAARLGWGLLPNLNPEFDQPWDQFRRRFGWVDVSAFESYLRGVTATDRGQKIRYWLQSARLASGYSPPAYHLGRAYLEEENVVEAALWLRQVPAGDPYGPDAQFYRSLAEFRRGNVDSAFQTMRPLVERYPVKGVWNNAAVFASRAGSDEADALFESAIASDPMDPDLQFNLGLHHLRWQRADEAATVLFEALELNPGDVEARFLLARALALTGRIEESKSVEQQAVGDRPDLARDLAARQYALDRLEFSFSSALAQLQIREREQAGESAPRAEHLRLHLERAAELAGQGQGSLNAAREEFVQAILLDPQSYEAHFGLANVREKQGRIEDAVAELQAAIWSRDTPQARVRLARIYIVLERMADARKQADAALALDPDDAEVRTLAKELGLVDSVSLGGGGLS